MIKNYLRLVSLISMIVIVVSTSMIPIITSTETYDHESKNQKITQSYTPGPYQIHFAFINGVAGLWGESKLSEPFLSLNERIWGLVPTGNVVLRGYIIDESRSIFKFRLTLVLWPGDQFKGDFTGLKLPDDDGCHLFGFFSGTACHWPNEIP